MAPDFERSHSRNHFIWTGFWEY